MALLGFPPGVVANQHPAPPEVDRLVLQDMSEGHLQQRLATIEKLYGKVAAFVHMNPTWTGLHANGKSVILHEAEKSVVQHVFLMAKHLKQSLNNAAGLTGRSCFVTVARLDGELGVGAGGGFSVIGGGLFGLTKSLNHEWGAVFCRAVDLHPQLDATQAAHCVVAELHDPNQLIGEVGYSARGRATLAAE